MKHAREMASAAVIFRPSLIKISAIQKLTGRVEGYTDTDSMVIA
jgi:hypothetical protein